MPTSWLVGGGGGAAGAFGLSSAMTTGFRVGLKTGRASTSHRLALDGGRNGSPMAGLGKGRSRGTDGICGIETGATLTQKQKATSRAQNKPSALWSIETSAR